MKPRRMVPPTRPEVSTAGAGGATLGPHEATLRAGLERPPLPVPSRQRRVRRARRAGQPHLRRTPAARCADRTLARALPGIALRRLRRLARRRQPAGQHPLRRRRADPPRQSPARPARAAHVRARSGARRRRAALRCECLRVREGRRRQRERAALPAAHRRRRVEAADRRQEPARPAGVRQRRQAHRVPRQRARRRELRHLRARPHDRRAAASRARRRGPVAVCRGLVARRHEAARHPLRVDRRELPARRGPRHRQGHAHRACGQGGHEDGGVAGALLARRPRRLFHLGPRR